MKLLLKLYGAFAVISKDGDYDEYIIDASTDCDSLRRYVNEFFATKEQINFHRNIQIKIPDDSFESNEYVSDGGGCFYKKRIVIKELPKLNNESKVLY